MVPKGIRRTMVLLLIIMTPGIPEYMTGSSKLSDLIFNPSSFFIGLLFNIALYSTGALLIREFAIKFKKGWATILLLGLAYGIMEEGISVHTFFIPSGNPVGLLGSYGRYLGVDWIWALGISFFHAIFSIALPILLLSIAYPERSRESLLGRKGTALVLFIYALDVIVLNIVVNSARPLAIPTPGDYVFFLLIAVILVLISRLLPGKWLSGKGKVKQGTKKFFIMGMLAFPLYSINAFISPAINEHHKLSPFLDAILFIISNLLILIAIARYMPEHDNRKHKFALAIGLITPLFVWAELVQLLGIARVITVVSIIAIIFLLKLRKLVKKDRQILESLPETV